MPLDLGIEKSKTGQPNILVVGVGGGGGNAVDNMIDSGLTDCTFLACNTDMQTLLSSQASERLQLGPTETRGLGAGANPEVGRIAAEESREDFVKFLKDVDMVFFAAGMGGGTGTGALPVMAECAREAGVLSMAVVTRPFRFEGRQRSKAADEGVTKLEKVVDTLIVVPNQKLIGHASQQTSIKDAFRLADSVLVNGVRSVVDLILRQGIVNLDFSDVCAIVRDGGNAMMGSAEAEGENRAREAAEHAVFNSLLENSSLKGAKNLIINITGGDDLGLLETDEASNFIESQVDQEANIIWGAVHDASMTGKLRVSVIATGIHVDHSNGTGEALRGVSRTPQILEPLPPLETQKQSNEQAPQPKTVQPQRPDIIGANSIPDGSMMSAKQETSTLEHKTTAFNPPSFETPSSEQENMSVQPNTNTFVQHAAQAAQLPQQPSSMPQDADLFSSEDRSQRQYPESASTKSYEPSRNPHEHYTQERGSFFGRVPWNRGSSEDSTEEQRPIASFLDKFGKKAAAPENNMTYPLREDGADTQKDQSTRNEDSKDEAKIPDFLMH